MKLTDNHTLCPVYDKLTAAYHNRNLTQVYHLLGDVGALVATQPAPNLERITVSQTKLTTLGSRITRFLKLIMQILQDHALVVAFNRKDFPEQRLYPLFLAILRLDVMLQKTLVANMLQRYQIRNGHRIFDLAEIAYLLRHHFKLQKSSLTFSPFYIRYPSMHHSIGVPHIQTPFLKPVT